MIHKLNSLILALVFVLGIVVPAQASLIGTFVDITSPDITSPTNGCRNVEVDDGAECEFFDSGTQDDDRISVGVNDRSIVISHFNDDPDGDDFVWSMSPKTFKIDISGLTWVDSPTTPIHSIQTLQDTFGNSVEAGSVGAQLTGPNQITYSFNDFQVNCGPQSECARFTIDITPEPKVVPTPSAFILMGTGLLGLIGYRRWSNKNS